MVDDRNKQRASTLLFVFVLLAIYQGGVQQAVSQPSDSVVVSAEEARHDLDDLHRQFQQRFSYLRFGNVDIEAAVEEVKADITGPIRVDELSDRISKLIALFVDGHAGPRLNTTSEVELPFKIEMSGPQYVAVEMDRSGFVNESMPYLRRIAGIPIERWIAAADPFIARGSPQLVRRRALRAVQRFGVLANLMGVPKDRGVTVELYNMEGMSTLQTVTLSVPNQSAEIEKQESPSGILPGNVGYLRIPSFRTSSDVPSLINEWMPRFKNTNALIIDVRGNGGGSRAGLVELFPYFLQEGESHIGNVSAYRLYDEFEEDHLSSARFSYRENDDRWEPWERRDIREFRQSFVPEWEHEEKEFSQWHYLMLSKREGDPRYYYPNDVYVLIDNGCFSATDIFVGAFKGFRNTLIVGQPTSGGSARSVTEELPNSGIRVRLASMVSFQPDGQLYDGRGILPDLHVDATPESFLIDGDDNVLNYVLRLIENANGVSIE